MTDTGVEEPQIVPSVHFEEEKCVATSSPKVIKYQYTIEELLDLQNAPESLKRPLFLDEPFCTAIVKRELDEGRSRGQGGARPDGEKGQRRAVDRLRTEEDFMGLGLLSPQRKTWGEGCHVNKNSEKGPGATSVRSHDDAERDVTLTQRRLGPPRGLRTESAENRFYQSRDRESLPRDKFGRNEHCDRDRPDRELYSSKERRERLNSDREGQRSRRPMEEQRDLRNGGRDPRDRFARDGVDTRKPNDRLGERGSRGQWSNRSGYQHAEEEPEWMSGGPTSKYDTIELKGFEEEEKKKKDKKVPGPKNMEKSKEIKQDVKVQSPSPEKAEIETESVKKVSRPPSRDPISDTTEIPKSDVRKELEENLNKKPGVGLSLEEFNKILTMDTLPDVSLGEFLEDFEGITDDTKESGSKFSKFFSASNLTDESSKPGSLLAKLGLKDTGTKPVDPNTILGEFLKGAQKRADVPPPPVLNQKLPTKALRLEDLEGGVASQKKEGERNIKPEAEMDAFKKLLAQVESKGLANGQLPNQPAKALPKTAITEEEFLSSVIGGPKKTHVHSLQATNQSGVPNDAFVKLTSTMQSSQSSGRPPLINQPPPLMAGYPPMSNDHGLTSLYQGSQNAEAHNLLRAVSLGHITVQDLLKHVTDPRLDRRLISAADQVLKVVAPREYAIYKGHFNPGLNEAAVRPSMPTSSTPRQPGSQAKSVYTDIPLSVIKRMTANKDAESNKAKTDTDVSLNKSLSPISSSDVSSVSTKKAPSKLTGRTVSQFPQIEKPVVKEDKSGASLDLFNQQTRQTTPPYLNQRHEGFSKSGHFPIDPRVGLSHPSMSEGLLHQLMGLPPQQNLRPSPTQFAPPSPAMMRAYPTAFDFQAKMRAERLPMSNEGLLSQMLGTSGGKQMHFGSYGFPSGRLENLEKNMQK
ncbi:eukaryotic translation initiation factor 4E transporter-like [Artemia franciscana]|uniref:eukaryotic translation initiation factor 4E transporter-like n=1 Tax=Artemia franciscana TaxID=6661 RepID=UPI0032DB13EA